MPGSPRLFKTPQGRDAYFSAYDATLEYWPVPWESRHVSTGAGRVHMIVSGPANAPPLLLLHMAATSATMWFPNIAGLSRNHRVYAIDTINDLGKSEPARPCRTRASSATWLLDLLDALQIDQTHVVGASYGGWLTLNLALAAPDRIRRLALLAPAGGLKPLSWRFFATMLPAALFPSQAATRRAMQYMTAEGFTPHPCLVDQMTTGFRHRTLQSIANLAIPTTFSASELQQINAPVLLLLGEHEIIYHPQAALKRARRLIPNLDSELLPNAGHGLSQEHPGYVNTRILNFLAGH